MSEQRLVEIPKLPQARKFLRAAEWGFQDLIENERMEAALVMRKPG